MKYLHILMLCFVIDILYSQQVPDLEFAPEITNKYEGVIYVDHAHNNFHRIDNRFKPFANVLKKAGYSVKAFENPFTEKNLKDVKVLVISNALSANSKSPFVTPTESAFTNKEIQNIKNWVAQGGALFLIADHMPFAGASKKLGDAFGFTFYDSFLFDKRNRGIFDYTEEENELGVHEVINGDDKSEKITSIRTFTGQAFKIPNKATSILKTNENLVVFLPDTMWRFSEKTKRFPAKNMSQGAVMKFKKGKVAVFGEAAMFTAQLAGKNKFKVGMNAPEASQNYKLLLNIIAWLTK
ncbi:hypothetical protein [Tenacibaculum amylolyticum]|uniref:hypothetical protein n=1 Tax=Tenacibaculum amylolyticum TaxID=104269 RepID=UPI003894FC8F